MCCRIILNLSVPLGLLLTLHVFLVLQALSKWDFHPDQRTMHAILKQAQLKMGRFDDATLTTLAYATAQLGYR